MHARTHTGTYLQCHKCRAGRCRHLKREPRALDEQPSATGREKDRGRDTEGGRERGRGGNALSHSAVISDE